MKIYIPSSEQFIQENTFNYHSKIYKNSGNKFLNWVRKLCFTVAEKIDKTQKDNFNVNYYMQQLKEENVLTPRKLDQASIKSITIDEKELVNSIFSSYHQTNYYLRQIHNKEVDTIIVSSKFFPRFIQEIGNYEFSYTMNQSVEYGHGTSKFNFNGLKIVCVPWAHECLFVNSKDFN